MSKTRKCQAKEPTHCKHHGTATRIEQLQAELKNMTDLNEYTQINNQIHKLQSQKDTAGRLLSNGEWVYKGEFKISSFIQQFNTREGTNSYYKGSWEDLENLVKTHEHNSEPGTGSVNGDVILVNVPPKGFYTSVVKIDSTNQHLVEETDVIRIEGEKPVGMKVIKGVKPEATHVQVVCYRADVLAQDNDRSNDAEWEIIAINAQPEKTVPMHPTTMLRNSNHEEGGTLRSYTEKEWSDAYEYWETHAYINEQ